VLLDEKSNIGWCLKQGSVEQKYELLTKKRKQLFFSVCVDGVLSQGYLLQCDTFITMPYFYYNAILLLHTMPYFYNNAILLLQCHTFITMPYFYYNAILLLQCQGYLRPPSIHLKSLSKKGSSVWYPTIKKN
jgi:hypothetical protein